MGIMGERKEGRKKQSECMDCLHRQQLQEDSLLPRPSLIRSPASLSARKFAPTSLPSSFPSPFSRLPASSAAARQKWTQERPHRFLLPAKAGASPLRDENSPAHLSLETERNLRTEKKVRASHISSGLVL